MIHVPVDACPPHDRTLRHPCEMPLHSSSVACMYLLAYPLQFEHRLLHVGYISPFWKVSSHLSGKEIPEFHGKQKFISTSQDPATGTSFHAAKSTLHSYT